MATTPSWLVGEREIYPDGSVRLDAISRNLWVAVPVLGAAICSMVGVLSSHGWLWFVGSGVMLPFILAATRRRLFVFDAPNRALEISGSGGSRSIAFDEIRAFDLVSDKTHGPLLLTVNNEALCWVQNTHANRALKDELGAALNPRPSAAA